MKYTYYRDIVIATVTSDSDRWQGIKYNKVHNVTKYKMLQSAKCYKVQNVTKYMILQSTNCYLCINVTKYKMWQITKML